MLTLLRARSALASALVAASVATAAAIGCTGVIGDEAGSGFGPSSGGGSGIGPDGKPDALVDSTRFPRLTHQQWENTVRDLLRLADRPGLSSSFTTDPPGSTFGNDGNLLKVTPGLWGDYQKAAETLAANLVKDPAALAKVLPAGLPASGDARLRAFVEGFGMRAFRRPLEPAEVDAFVALGKQGPTVIGGTDDFASGVNLVVQGMLQAPSFVYRVELGEVDDDGSIRLSSWEMASRLSYALWNTMPDEALLAAAADGSLRDPTVVEAQAKRMLDDERAAPTIADFHAKLFQYDHFQNLKKDATLFPEWSKITGDTLVKEADLFVRDVTVTRGLGLTELLTADYTFVNDALAPLYGLSGSFGSEHVKAKLDPSQRAGILTQIGFLASRASMKETDPIHRGVLVNLNVICADLPPPPMTIPPLPPDEGGTMTMRERITAHTSNDACVGCHGKMINPVGFAYESFDAAGRWRTTDHGKPVDTKASYPFEDGVQTYDGAVELAKVLAQRPQVHRCYVGNWLEYAYGRRKADGDATLVDRVMKASLAGGSTKDVILKLVLERSFSHRPAPGGS